MSAIGRKWREDAVVDTCGKDQIVASSDTLREIDLKTFKTEGIPFKAGFKIKMERDDYVNVC